MIRPRPLPKKLSYQNQQKTKYSFNRFLNKPFWIWDKEEHTKLVAQTKRNCCFNHILGLPRKANEPKPLFPFEKPIIESIQQYENLWIKKARGLGVTELILRYMCYLCLTSTKYKNTRMCIVTGPRIDTAIDLIDRIRDMFYEYADFDSTTKQTLVILNGVKIQAFPSHTVGTMRGYDDVSFIFLDEADFFPKGQQKEARDVAEGYILKSKPHIVMVSTPDKPGGLFDTMERQSEEEHGYHKMFLDYTHGLGTMYDPLEIEREKTKDYFEREYNLKYLGKVGNVFSISDINAITTTEYDPFDSTDPFIGKAMGIDEGFESSATGIVIQQYKDHKVEIVYADQMEHSSITEVIEFVHSMINKHYISKVFVDASSPGFIRDLKQSIGEYTHYERYTKEELNNKIYKGNMIICPIHFGNNNDKTLLYNAKNIVEKHRIRIHPQFDKLITSLKTAYAEDMDLDKEQTSFDDILDAFRLSLQNVKFT